MIVVLDGAVSAAADARIPALDRSAWYGDAAFETFRAHGGRVLALEARLARLSSSCERLGFACPPAALLAKELGEGLAALGEGDAYVRIAVSRGVGGHGLLPSDEPAVSRSIFVGPLPPLPEQLYRDGIRVITLRSAVEPTGVRARGAKVASYVEPMLALAEARGGGADDAIGLDRDGFLLEAATANVLVWDGAALLTPPDVLGILPGVTRDLVLSSEAGRRFGARPRMISVQDAYRAREIVLTSSIRGLVAVVRIDGLPVGEGRPGPVFRALREAYEARIAAEARAPA